MDYEEGTNDYNRLCRKWDTKFNDVDFPRQDFVPAFRYLTASNAIRSNMANLIVRYLQDIRYTTTHDEDDMVDRGISIIRRAIEPDAEQDQYTEGHPRLHQQRFIGTLTAIEEKWAFLRALLSGLGDCKRPGKGKTGGQHAGGVQNQQGIEDQLRSVMKHGVKLGVAFLQMGIIPIGSEGMRTAWHEAVLDVIKWYPSVGLPGDRDDDGNDNEDDDDNGNDNWDLYDSGGEEEEIAEDLADEGGEHNHDDADENDEVGAGY